MPNIQHNPNDDVLKATKDLLQNNEYAINAIHARNIKIKTLEDIIKHNEIAFHEIEARYQHLAETKKEKENENEELLKNYATLFELYENDKTYHEKCLKQLEEYQTKLNKYKIQEEKSFTHKIENYANALGGIRGAFIKLMFTPPVSKIIFIFIFMVLILASVVGWDEIGKIFTVISKIF